MPSKIKINSRVASTLQVGDVIAQSAYYGQSFLSVAFNPITLFANGEQGAWYDPSDLSTLFQDDAGTTPVTEPGQTVGLMLDKSGNANHATQSTAESRPVYQAGGGLHWLEFDGVDDLFHVPVIKETPGPVSFFTGFQRFISDRLQFIMDIEDGRFVVAAGSDSDDHSGFFGPGNWRETETDNNTPYILSALYGTANGSLRLNGVQYSEVEGSERALAGSIKIGESGAGNHQLNGKMFSLVVIARIAEFDEVSATEQFIAQRSGVTL